MSKTCLICKEPTNQLSICETCAHELLLARNSYTYPLAYLRLSKTGEGIPGFFTTSMQLDKYHSSLLRSKNPNDIFLGLSSVVFWGYFIFGEAYSLNRTKWLQSGRDGQSGLVALGKRKLIHIVGSATQHIVNGRIDLGIKEISNIQELGQISFSSKITSFIEPKSCGIYDKVIHDQFKLMAPNQGGVTRPKANKYMDYCQYLKSIAIELNKGINLGYPWKWTDKNSSSYNWRTIDTERAIYSNR
jgi:hypothetical protein